MAEITPDPIMRIALGFMAAKHLFVASEIGVFEKLSDGPATLDELAAKSGIPRRTLRISADEMVSLGLLQREGDRYRNSETAAAFLAGNEGPDLRPMLRFWDKISYPAWLDLESAVRSGSGISASARSSNRSFLPESRRLRPEWRRRSQPTTISPVTAVCSMLPAERVRF